MKAFKLIIGALVSAASMMATAGPIATYSFNVTDVGSFGAGAYGSVTLEQISGDVSVMVSLRSDLNFVDTGESHAPFTFNIKGAVSSDITGISFYDGLGDVFAIDKDDVKNAPFGEFKFGIVCKSVVGNKCTKGGSGGGYADPLSFTVKNANLLDFAFLSEDGKPNAYFAADVINENGKTGAVGSTMTVVTAVPETETYAMMLAGLGLMGTIARRRKNKNA
jgi:PEP-CTERM motif